MIYFKCLKKTNYSTHITLSYVPGAYTKCSIIFFELFRRIFSGNEVQTFPTHRLVSTSKSLPDLFHTTVPKLKLHKAVHHVTNYHSYSSLSYKIALIVVFYYKILLDYVCCTSVMSKDEA